MNIAVILAGGTGSRVGADIPKQFIKIKGKPILAYTLEIFQENENIDAIEIVCHKDWIDEVENICNNYKISKKMWLCLGGNSFQESTINGIMNLREDLSDDDIVIISFGVSPMTPHEDINDSIQVCKEHGNAIASVDIDLCTCIKDNDESTTQNILRENLKGFGNPWTFKYGELYSAYKKAIDEGFIDDIEPHTTSLYFELGKRLWFSKCTTGLHKITRKIDLDIFEGYLMLKDKRRNKDDNL